jgi:hypothetical protein
MLFLLYILHNELFKYIWSWISVTLIACSHFLVPLKLQCGHFFPVDHLPLPVFVFPVSSIMQRVSMELLNQNNRWCECCLNSYLGGRCSCSTIQDRCRKALRCLSARVRKCQLCSYCHIVWTWLFQHFNLQVPYLLTDFIACRPGASGYIIHEHV